MVGVRGGKRRQVRRVICSSNDTWKTGTERQINGSGARIWKCRLQCREILDESGITVVAVSDSKGGIYHTDGLNPKDVLVNKKKTGVLSGGKQITNVQLLELPVDILVPSALESVIIKDNAAKIKAKVVLEMANGPTTPVADTLLYKKGIVLIPDILQ